MQRARARRAAHRAWPRTSVWYLLAPRSPHTRPHCLPPLASPSLASSCLTCNTTGSGAVGRGLQPEDAVVVFARSCGSVCNKQPLHTHTQQVPDPPPSQKAREFGCAKHPGGTYTIPFPLLFPRLHYRPLTGPRTRHLARKLGNLDAQNTRRAHTPSSLPFFACDRLIPRSSGLADIALAAARVWVSAAGRNASDRLRAYGSR